MFGTSSEFVDASEMVAGSVINLCDYLADTPREYDWFDSKRLEEQIRLAVRELDSMHDVKETLDVWGNLDLAGGSESGSRASRSHFSSLELQGTRIKPERRLHR